MKNREKITKDVLIDLYINKKLTQKEIAQQHNYSQAGIFKLLKKYDISSRKVGHHCITHGKCTKQYYCEDCLQVISDHRHKRCVKCFNKSNNAKWTSKDTEGKNNFGYKDGRTLKTYKCRYCDNEISTQNYLYKQGYCKYCEIQIRTFKYSTKTFEYNNNLFRSSWESNFAKWCDLSGIKWLYESKTFDVLINNKERKYTPDFYLPEFDCHIEIKGRWYKDAKNKFVEFNKQYSRVSLFLFDEAVLKNMRII